MFDAKSMMGEGTMKMVLQMIPPDFITNMIQQIVGQDPSQLLKIIDPEIIIPEGMIPEIGVIRNPVSGDNFVMVRATNGQTMETQFIKVVAIKDLLVGANQKIQEILNSATNG